jgi:rubrerythrin
MQRQAVLKFWSLWWLDSMLQLTYASERGAATAYRGHAKAVRDPEHQAIITQIVADELHHRDRLLVLMEARGVRPVPWLDAVFLGVGTCVGFGCGIWPEWASALGASWFETNGVSEYRRLAMLARYADQSDLIEIFEEMAEQEQAHRDTFSRMAWGG